MFLLITPYKFTKFSYLNYELDIFKEKKNISFEIHDLSNLVNPTWTSAFKVKRHKQAKVFISIQQWEKHLENLKKKYNKLIVYNELDLNSFKSLIMQYKLSQHFTKIIQFRSPGIPSRIDEKVIKINFSNIRDKILKIGNFNMFFFFIKKMCIKLFSRLIKFEKIFVLCCGEKINYHLNLRAKKTYFVKCHFRDFSRYLYYKTKNKLSKKSYIVYLDTAGPYFQDDYDLFQKKINYDITKWYYDLNNFLSTIEKAYSSKVIIIPHPKVKNSFNPYYKKSFKVCSDLDAVHKLVPASKFVISINGSTAIGLAIACQKPVVLIYNDQQKQKNQELFRDLKFISKKCGSKLVNINNYQTKSIYNKVNKKIYKKYFNDYISTKNISKKRNYEIINNLI